ncbi:MAG: DUF192 domain-containing protein [Kiloniellales bacterium]|nr:DUF192 domain-containing protein [Kiloniellales bacterium]
MPRTTFRIFALFLFLTTTASPLFAQTALQTFERDALIIETADGERHEFDIEMAVSWEQQVQGLMFRREMAADSGMLFVYHEQGPRTMWMKNTFIPLDMLFIDEAGLVVGIVERTVPHSLNTITVEKDAKAVLELNGGTVKRLGLQVGDRIRHEAFEGKS